MEARPLQPADDGLSARVAAALPDVGQSLLSELWLQSNCSSWGLEREEFDSIVLAECAAQNFGIEKETSASTQQQTAFLSGLKLDDLVLARACGHGNEKAWAHFLATYGQPLTRAAISICGSETLGRDIADSLYAELYGLTMREGERRCPLDSYRGRGSLLGWLRTTLVQRHVDHHRRSHREQPLEDFDAAAPASQQNAPSADLPALASAVQQALSRLDPEDQFLLAAYYLDGKRLAQIGAVLGFHEATASRKLKRATEAVRKHVRRALLDSGMSRREIEEALSTDPRDLDMKFDLAADATVKKLMQSSQPRPFLDKTRSDEAAL